MKHLNILVLLLVLVFVGCDRSAKVEEPKTAEAKPIVIYKDYVFGMGKPDIEKLPGVKNCSQGELDALCLPGQAFADYKWEQTFLFYQGKLFGVALTRAFSQDCYLKAFGAVVNNGFVPVHVESGSAAYDFIATEKAQGKEAAVAGINAFEQKALSAGHASYTFVQKDILPQVVPVGTVQELLSKAPLSMRIVEIEVADGPGKPWIAVRFQALSAVREMLSQKVKRSKEKF
jgi:hypothetical protein